MKNLIISAIIALSFTTSAHAFSKLNNTPTTIESEIQRAEADFPANVPVPTPRPVADTTCLKFYKGKCAPGYAVRQGRESFLSRLQPIPNAN